ncbi:MAG TPA: hypothetical protein VHX15_21900 [Frankiaceae bacterium]|jgi:hypothetical protein|nr:hypothetical protein [Frankiaceae bacterium]
MSETPAVPEAATGEAAPQTATNEATAQTATGEAAPAVAERITFQSMADRLTLGLLASVIGAVLVFVSAFLTWSTVDARSQAGDKLAGAVTDSIGIAGGRLGTATLVLSLAALAVVAVMLLPATKPWAWRLLLGAGALSAALALYDLISIPKTLRPDNFTCPAGISCTFHRTLGPGVWFTLIASLLIVAGAYVHHIRPVPFRSPGPHPGRGKRRIVDLTKAG